MPEPVAAPAFVPAPRGECAKITTITFGVIGMMVWSASIGCLIGWSYYYFQYRLIVGSSVSVPTNAGLIFVGSRIIFLVTDGRFPSTDKLQNLRKCVSRMVAVTVLSFTFWITSIVWLSIYTDEGDIVYHACNYGFIFGAVVAGTSGSLLQESVQASPYSPLPQSVLPVPAAPVSYPVPPPPQTYYNRGFFPPSRAS